MKEGLLGGTLDVSPRSESKEARLRGLRMRVTTILAASALVVGPLRLALQLPMTGWGGELDL
jgi:hypothetical protein